MPAATLNSRGAEFSLLGGPLHRLGKFARYIAQATYLAFLAILLGASVLLLGPLAVFAWRP